MHTRITADARLAIPATADTVEALGAHNALHEAAIETFAWRVPSHVLVEV